MEATTFLKSCKIVKNPLAIPYDAYLVGHSVIVPLGYQLFIYDRYGYYERYAIKTNKLNLFTIK